MEPPEKSGKHRDISGAWIGSAFNLSQLGLGRAAHLHVAQQTAAVELDPLWLGGYFLLAKLLLSAKHSRHAPQFGSVRRLHYAAALLDGLAFTVKTVEQTDAEIAKLWQNIGAEMATAYINVTDELAKAVFGKRISVLGASTCCVWPSPFLVLWCWSFCTL